MESLGARTSRSVVAAIPLVLVPALGLTQGGFQPDAWVWAGALAAWAAAIAVVVSPNPGALRGQWPWAAAAGALLLWTLASATWSVHAAQSVLEARRTLLYAAVVLALLLLARRDASRLLVPATHIAVAALIVYALGHYLLGARRSTEFEAFLLFEPLGYANAVGIVAALGILLAVGIAAESSARLRRGAVAATVPPLAVALLFAQSTASWLALAVGCAVTAVLGQATVRFLATLAIVTPPTAVLLWVGNYSRFAADVPTPRLSGAAVAGITVACAAAAGALAARMRLPAARPSTARTRRLILATVVVLALAAGAAVAHTGAKEPRASYFHVAWHDEYLAHPLLGSGAGTFGRYWERDGKPLELGGALDAHSLYLETLAELGPIGLVLLLAVLLVPLRSTLRRRNAPYVPAALGAYAAFLVHAGLDWDWELPVVVVTALCCAAAVGAAELGPERPLGRAARGAVLAVALVLGGSAIAGARSNTVPEAAPNPERAPRRGALSQTRA